jgi:hypothetical protein
MGTSGVAYLINSGDHVDEWHRKIVNLLQTELSFYLVQFEILQRSIK